MLKLYATEARSRFTLMYRGYDLEVTRAPSGWFVGVYPRSADTGPAYGPAGSPSPL
jgi:hypothetical protein